MKMARWAPRSPPAPRGDPEAPGGFRRPAILPVSPGDEKSDPHGGSRWFRYDLRVTESRKHRRQTRVPAGRLERLARLGWMAGEVAAGGVGGGAGAPGGAGPARAAR